MAGTGGDPSAGEGRQVWLLGNSHLNADRSISWDDTLPNLADSDDLIVDLTTLTRDVIRRIGSQKLGQARKCIEDKFFGGKGSVIVVITTDEFSAPPLDDATGLPIDSRPGPLADPHAHSNYRILPVVLSTAPVADGSRILPDEGHDYREYLDAVGHFKFYITGYDRTVRSSFHNREFYLDRVGGQDAKDNSGHYLGFTLAAAAVESDIPPERINDTGYLTFLPPPTEPAADAIGRLLSLFGKESPGEGTPPPWVEKMSLANADKLQTQIAGLEERAAAIHDQIGELRSQKDEMLAHRRLLYSDGPKLEDAVVEAFRALGFDDIERMGNRDEEDASFGMGGGGTHYSRCAIEAKGAGKGTKMDHILQCVRWAEQRAEAENSPTKGVFVPNQHRLKPYPDSRGIRTRIEDNQLEHAERKDICIIPSCVLYEAVRRVLDGETPDRAKIAARIAGAKGVLTDVL